MFTLKIPMSGDKITGGDQKWFPSMWLELVGRGGEGRSKTLEDVAAAKQPQRLSPLLKRPVWNHGACPCLRPPTPFLDEPDGLADLHPLSWSRMSPVLALG